MKQTVYFLAGFILFSTSISFAQDACLSGSPSARNLIDQLTSAKKNSAVTRIISEQYNLDRKTEACVAGRCEMKSASLPAATQLKSLSETIRSATPGSALLFKKECLATSNTFKATTPQYQCPSGHRSSESSCITEDQLTYQNAVISSFVKCTTIEGLNGVEGKALFEMFSKESGFRPNYSYPGGVGIGQLTQIFVEDIHQKHRGRKSLEQIANSTNSDCAAAKLIATKDLQAKPSITNRCSFIGTGEGMERNILYTMVGMATAWQKDIKPVLQSYLDKYSNNPLIDEVKDLALLNAYGPGGRGAARAAVSRLKALKPEQFIKAMKKPMYRNQGKSLTVYTTNLAKRQNSIAKLLPEPVRSEFAEKGANACLNTF